MKFYVLQCIILCRTNFKDVYFLLTNISEKRKIIKLFQGHIRNSMIPRRSSLRVNNFGSNRIKIIRFGYQSKIE